jgi:4-diphosphocytidyl-2C-methyl-D-erythritol kinase
MKAALLAEGARQAGLSGSGSTVFALFSRRAAAQRAAERLAETGRVFLVQTLPGQAYRRALGLWLK